MKIDLLGQTGASRDNSVLYELTQNWYPHLEKTGKSQLVLYPTPGLAAFAITTAGPIRGMIEYNSLLYVVSLNTLWEITSAGVSTSRGTLNTSSGRVSMASNGAANGEELMMVDGTNGYILDTSGAPTFTVIADPDFPDTATHIEFMDSYFLVNDPSVTGRWQMSDSYDGTSWDALNFATAERSPDDLQALIVSNRIVWLLGTETAEAWHNAGAGTGTVAFPFEPLQSGFSEWGCAAKYSPAEMAGSVFWLSSNSEGDSQVVMTNGLTPTIISTTSITTEINALTTISDAYGYTYQYNGHSFYVLTFPTEGRTFVFDLVTKMWHEWASKVTGNHRSTHHVFIFSKHLVGDSETGRVFELDWDTYTDNGDTITRIRRSRPIHAEDKAVRHTGVWIDIKEGVGNSAVTDPQIVLRYRDDAGGWSNEKWRSMGKIGQHNVRCVWRRLGRSRDRVYEIKVTDAVQAIIIAAYARLAVDEEELR